MPILPVEFSFSLKVAVRKRRRLAVRNEPQHDHASATTKTKMRVPLNGFSHSQNIVPFAITNVGVRELTANLRELVNA